VVVPVASLTISPKVFNPNWGQNLTACCQYMLTGLTPYTQYGVRVQAMNIAGSGPVSSPLLLRTAQQRNVFCIFNFQKK